MLILGLIAIPASAQTTVSATTTTGGNWTATSPTPTWVCSPALSPCLPNNNVSDVFDVGINGGTVTLDNTSSPSNITIDSLSVTSSGTLNILNGATLTLAGTNNLTSAGSIIVGFYGSTNGSTLNIGGNLTNTGTTTVGGVNANGLMNVAGTLNDANGALHIIGGDTAGVPSKVNVSGAAPSTFEGDAELYGYTGGAILNYGSGAISTIGGGGSNPSGTIILDGANASVEINNASGNSALTTLSNITSNGDLDLRDGAVVTTNGNLTNAGTIFDGFYSNSGANGSTLNIGGNLANSGATYVGGSGSNGILTVAGTLNDANGALHIIGGDTAGVPSKVNVSGAAPSTFEGDAELYGYTGGAILNYGSGAISTIGGGGSNPIGTIILDGANTSVEIANVSGNSALTTLANIATNGTLNLRDGAVVTTNGNLTNAGTIFDGFYSNSGANGSTLNIGGNLANSGATYVGGSSSNGILTVAGTLNDANGALHIIGGDTAGVPSKVNVSGAAPSTFEGDAELYGYTGGAILNYGSGAITQIGGGNSNPSGTIILDGANTSVEIANVGGNSALTTLANIATNGTLNLLDGAVVTTNGNPTNAGTIFDGFYSNSGTNGSTLNVGGNLANSGATYVGGGSSNGLLNVTGTLDDAGGSLQIRGGDTAGVPSKVNVSTAAPLTFEGDAELYGQTGGAILNYASGSITQIGGGASNPSGTIILDGANASVEINNASGNSALTTLANIASNGDLDLRDGAVVTTSGDLTNAGTVFVGYEGNGTSGSTLNVGGNLTNTGSMYVGSNSNGVVNASSISNAGLAQIDSTGLLNSVSSYTQTGYSAATGVEGTVSAASLDVEGGAYTNDTGITNLGTVSGSPAPGSINIGSNGSLTDNATINVGKVVGPPNRSQSVSGTVNNAGSVTVGSADNLTLLDDGTYTQSAGSSSINGVLTAATVNINGGTLGGTGTIQGGTVSTPAASNVTIGSAGTIQAGTASTPGALNITGALTIKGTLGEAINSASVFDALNITGPLSLGSSSVLDILLGSGYTPGPGASFTIASFTGGLTGAFGSITNPTFNSGSETWDVAYNSNGIVLTAAGVAPSTVTATWNTPSGNWTTATEWSCAPGAANCMPNNGTPAKTTYNAVVNSSGNTLALNSTSSPSSVTVNSLALTAGTLDIGSGATLNLSNQPTGLTDIAASSGLSVEGTFTAGSNNALADLTSVEGALKLDNGQTTTVTPGGSPATLTVNGGSMYVSGASTNMAVNGGLKNSAGAVTVGSGAVLSTTSTYDQIGSSAATDVNGTLTTSAYDMDGGTTHVETGGNLNVTSATSNSNNLYDATGGTTTVDGTLTTYSYDTAGGNTTVTNGSQLTTTLYDQSAAGSLTTVNTGGTLSATTSYNQSAGTTDVDGTLMTPNYNLTGELLTGTGTAKGDVSNTGGTLDPGDGTGAAGTFNITGNYSQSGSGVLLTDINSGAANGWDMLDISGTATLGGTLDISLNNGFLPTNSEMFQILDATGGLGGTTFASIMNDTFGSNGTWLVNYGADTVTLEAHYSGHTPTPEPASLLLFGSGLIGLALVTRRRMKKTA